MNKITENLVDNMVHDVIKQLSSAGICLDSDLLADLNDTMTDWFVDYCDIEVQETVEFNELSKTQLEKWNEASVLHSVPAIALYDTHNGVIPQEIIPVNVKHEFSIIDESAENKYLNGHIVNTDNLGLALQFDGYSDHYSNEESGTIIYIECFDNKLRAILYNDINQKSPSHVIDFEKANNAHRAEPIKYDRSIGG